MKTISEVLGSRKYPGRGIIMGVSPDGTKMTVAYFIMGRSENSRNRVFEETPTGLRTRAFDESKVTDPGLIIYNPVVVIGDRLIVTNGEQTDQIAALMTGRHQLTFAQALHFNKFEPDAPIYTPRISAIMGCDNPHYSLSISKTADGNPDSCQRFVYSYDEPVAGQGHCIHTYGDDDVNLPSFCGEPHTLTTQDNIDTFTDEIWSALNADNKVSLYTRFVTIETNEYETRLINKYE
ncbi:MAG: IMP cyclohydrolase [Oscillospiraceae bacterium]|nr:IMP cyclohydrolase [Oscillospiraceae bacterium]